MPKKRLRGPVQPPPTIHVTVRRRYVFSGGEKRIYPRGLCGVNLYEGRDAKPTRGPREILSSCKVSRTAGTKNLVRYAIIVVML